MTRLHRTTSTLVSALLITLAAASHGAAQDFESEATDSETHTLALGTTGALELKNISGTIECVVGTGADVIVRVERRARGRSDGDARMGLAEVRVAVDQQADRASVTVQYPPNRRNPPYSVDVHYAVTAPAGTRLTVTSVSGDIGVREITGDLNATTVSGDVVVEGAGAVARAASVSGDVSVTGGDTDGGMEAESVSGDVRLDNVRADRIDARSVSGDVDVTNAAAARTSLASTSGDVGYEGTLVPQGRYEVRSHSGDVRIVAATGTGYELRATTFSGSIRTEPATASADTDDRRTVRQTVGDGSAVVEATTFSGDITVATR